MIKAQKLLFASFLIGNLAFSSENLNPDSYVVGSLIGQLGNNLFQVATTCAVAWDNQTEAYFPLLNSLPALYHHVFSRCKADPPSDQVDYEWGEPRFRYTPIVYHPKQRLSGYFQSEKYFLHHRERLLDLFAPCTKDKKYIEKKYRRILTHPNTVGVQLRYYFEDPDANIFIQYGKDYFTKAMSLFPDTSLFIVSSNNIEFARKNIPEKKNVIFLESEKYYIDFYILSLCKHNIITNSSFGWWTAWLNQNPDKIVVRPMRWFNGIDTSDVCPESWIQVDGKAGRISDPSSY